MGSKTDRTTSGTRAQTTVGGYL